MGKKAGNDEFEAILSNEDFDSAKIAAQIMGEGNPEDIKTDPVKTDPVKTDTVKTDPIKTDPIKTDLVKDDPKKDVPDPEAIKAGVLNEMFGDQFKTVEDVKKANIPASLKELATLREENQGLKTQLGAKPKHQFVNDDIAKLNEFIRETGIKDVGIFNRINGVDLANMSDIDALVLNYIVENPRLQSKNPQDVRAYFERKYGVDKALIDPKMVEEGKLTEEQLEENKRKYTFGEMEMESDAHKAKDKLIELQGKIKMPAESSDNPPADTKWKPEVEKAQKEAWTTVSNAVIEKFGSIPLSIPGKDGKPVVVANFALPEEAKTKLLERAVQYVLDNQMEVNEANVTTIASSMYSDIRTTYFDQILHTVFERARSMSDKEYLEALHNPSKKNDDQPDKKEGPLSDEEIQAKAYQMEVNR